jgi:YVTN family beta-propeller protein
VATVTVGHGPTGVAVNPAGTRVYVTNWHANSMSVIDTATNTIVATVRTGESPGHVSVK